MAGLDKVPWSRPGPVDFSTGQVTFHSGKVKGPGKLSFNLIKKVK